MQANLPGVFYRLLLVYFGNENIFFFDFCCKKRVLVYKNAKSQA